MKRPFATDCGRKPEIIRGAGYDTRSQEMAGWGKLPIAIGSRRRGVLIWKEKVERKGQESARTAHERKPAVRLEKCTLGKRIGDEGSGEGEKRPKWGATNSQTLQKIREDKKGPKGSQEMRGPSGGPRRGPIWRGAQEVEKKRKASYFNRCRKNLSYKPTR